MQILDNIYDVLTSPREFFAGLNADEHKVKLSLAIWTLCITNVVFFTLKYDFGQSSFWGYLPQMVVSCLGGIILLYLAGAFFEFVAKIFNKSGKMKPIMCAFAYSTVPLILFAPVQLLKPIGQIGYFLGVVFEIILYFWSIYLMAKAIEITYELSFSRAVMIIFLPVICSFVSVFWLIEFFSKIIYIFKI